MERRNIPREVILEPKVFGSFTWKKLGYAIGGGVIFYLSFFVLPFPFWIRLPLSLVVVAISICFVFLEPHGRPFEDFLLSYLLFLLRPKRKLWGKEPQRVMESLERKFPLLFEVSWYGVPLAPEDEREKEDSLPPPYLPTGGVPNNLFFPERR